MTTDDGGVVSYRVKDLLDQINSKLDVALLTLEKKANYTMVRELNERVTALEMKATIEADRETQSAGVFSRREKALGLLIAATSIGLPAVMQFLHVH